MKIIGLEDHQRKDHLLMEIQVMSRWRRGNISIISILICYRVIRHETSSLYR